MKLIIGDYEINISAKNLEFDKKNSLLRTMYFLNECSIAFNEASKQIAERTPITSKRYEKMADDIYAALRAAGAYKEV